MEDQNTKFSHFESDFFLAESTYQKLLDLLRMLWSVPHINLDKVRLSTPMSLCMAPGTVNRQQSSEYQKAVLNDYYFFSYNHSQIC